MSKAKIWLDNSELRIISDALDHFRSILLDEREHLAVEKIIQLREKIEREIS